MFDRDLLRRTGAAFAPALLDAAGLESLAALAEDLPPGSAGQRLGGGAHLKRLLNQNGPVHALAAAALGPGARPVRAVLFDKSPQTNWAVAWHQDRTIAVRERVEVEGFGPWSRKADVLHVEPPFRVIEAMVTVRVHLDACDADNAPLLAAAGSHRLGRIPSDQTAEWARRLETVTCLAQPGDAWI